MNEFKEGLGEGSETEAATQAPVEEGYSSLEIAAESGNEEAEATAEEVEAAEPDHEADAGETTSEEKTEEDSKKE